MPTELIVPSAILASTNLGGTVADIDEVIDLGSGALFEEFWTGSNSDPWPSARWETPTLGSTSVVDIQGNAGRMVSQGAAYARAYINSKSGTIDDFDLTVQMTRSTGSEQYQVIIFRHDGTYSSNFPNNTYWAEMASWDFDTVNRLILVKRISGSRTDITFVTKVWGTSLWNIRIQAIGSAIKVKAWQGSEPGTWDIEQTDTDRSSGLFSFGNVNGDTSTARTGTFDNLVVMPA